jgi:hypothetical protein
MNIFITGDLAGGYGLIAGNAGDGDIGKVGGSILNYHDIGSITSQIVLQSGNGGRGLLGAVATAELSNLSTIQESLRSTQPLE